MTLKERFQSNLTEYQSIPFWSWNDRLQPEELRRQIRAMKKAGIGGFFMHARGGLTTPYLGKEWFDATAACIDEAEKQGMDAWCYDENGWPSGFAGMKLLEDRNNWEHFLVCETKEALDPEALCVFVMRGDDIVRVKAPCDGESKYICIYDKQNSSVVDILNPDIVRKFLDETHEKYYARFADSFGKAMKGFFTDEPQYFRWDTAYTPVMLAEYEKLYGEDLLDTLGALFVDCKQSYKLRFRYWKLMHSLYLSSFCKQIYDWCTEHNCQLTGHSIDENSLFGQLMCSGGVMPFYKYEHKPGIDWLGRGIASELCPKQIGSAAQQLGRKHVLTETFACAGWDVTPKELKRIAEFQYVNGVNQMCQHLYPYSIRGQRKRDYPAFYSEHNSWTQTAAFRRFNDFFTNLGYMLAETREIADVAVIHPVHSAYLTFKRNERDCVKKLSDSFTELIEKVGAANIGHHFVDEELLAEDGSVDGAALVMGKCRYHAVVIPAMDGLDSSTVKLLREYAANGGKIWLQGKAPRFVDGEEADLSFLKANISFEDLVSDKYEIDRKDTFIRSTMHTGELGNFLYAVNLSETETYSVTWRFAAKDAALVDLLSGELKPLRYAKTDDGISVSLTFRPGDSFVIMLDCGMASDDTLAVAEIPLILPDLCGVEGENNLTLDTASVSFDGENWGEKLPIMAVSDLLLRRKTNGRVYLRYTFTCETLPESIRLEAEKMNAASVTLGGQTLAMNGQGGYDPAFVTCDITKLVKIGENSIVFAIDYYQSQEVYDIFNGVYYEHSDGTESLINCLSYITDIEDVYLRGSFGVKCEGFVPGAKDTLLTSGGFVLTALNKSADKSRLAQAGYPFFGGTMKLTFDCVCTGEENTLTLSGRYLIADVKVNGEIVGSLLFDNKLSVAGLVKKGNNKVEITLISSYRNVFGPFHFARDPEPYGVSPTLFSGYGTWEDGKSREYAPAYAFKFFGLE